MTVLLSSNPKIWTDKSFKFSENDKKSERAKPNPTQNPFLSGLYDLINLVWLVISVNSETVAQSSLLVRKWYISDWIPSGNSPRCSNKGVAVKPVTFPKLARPSTHL